MVKYDIPAIEDAFRTVSARKDYEPGLLYCLVDKKINTRFLKKGHSHQYLNPDSGTTVNSGLTEHFSLENLPMKPSTSATADYKEEVKEMHHEETAAPDE